AGVRDPDRAALPPHAARRQARGDVARRVMRPAHSGAGRPWNHYPYCFLPPAFPSCRPFRRRMGPATRTMSSAAQALETAVEQPQLAISGVSKRFGGVRAVEDVSVSVGQGEIVSIIGPNGAGKTTLLNIVSGLFQPNSGSILLEGRDITGERPSRIAAMGVARTFQNIALFNGMTVLDNIILGRQVPMGSGLFASVGYWGMAQNEEAEHR